MCLSAILMGTLYWFFYGTAFVIGLLEIIAGELDTGTTRFIAGNSTTLSITMGFPETPLNEIACGCSVSVKTFVLCLGSAFGLMITMGGETHAKWLQQADNCGCPLGPVWDGVSTAKTPKLWPNKYSFRSISGLFWVKTTSLSGHHSRFGTTQAIPASAKPRVMATQTSHFLTQNRLKIDRKLLPPPATFGVCALHPSDVSEKLLVVADPTGREMVADSSVSAVLRGGAGAVSSPNPPLLAWVGRPAGCV